jgi:LysR family transcriptional regulator, transcription activator of glutamate synthase operon
MELRQLLCFERVADLGSISKAAAALHIVQPAVSQQVAQLEREVGLRLFHRGPRGVRLTEAGEALLPYARRVLAEVERAGQLLGGLRELRGGRVAVGLTPSAVLWLLPNLLERYRRQHPLVQVQVAEDMTDALVDQLHDGRLDLALVSLPVEDARLAVRPLFEERLELVVGPDHHLAGAEQVDLADLAEEPWILPYRRHGVRALLEAACAEAGFELRVAVELSGLGPIKQLVQRGLGLSVLPPAVVANEVHLGQLRAIPIARPPLIRGIGLARRRHETLTPAAAAMEAAITAVARERPESRAASGRDDES